MPTIHDFANRNMLFRRRICLLALMISAACTEKNDPSTFQGQPLIKGSDPSAVVHTIDDSDYPAVILTNENGAVGIAVFQSRTGAPVLALRDGNNDGVFDLLTYDALSESGELLASVEDYGMDGQPDFVLNYADSTAAVYVNGKWHEVEGIGAESATVLLDGKHVPLTDVIAELRGPD